MEKDPWKLWLKCNISARNRRHVQRCNGSADLSSDFEPQLRDRQKNNARIVELKAPMKPMAKYSRKHRGITYAEDASASSGPSTRRERQALRMG